MEEEKVLEEYTLDELQEALENLFEKYYKFKGADKIKVSKNYTKIASLYNEKVGFQAYRTKL